MMPKQTDNWCRRKERRCNRKGSVFVSAGISWVSLVSRRYPLVISEDSYYALPVDKEALDA